MTKIEQVLETATNLRLQVDAHDDLLKAVIHRIERMFVELRSVVAVVVYQPNEWSFCSLEFCTARDGRRYMSWGVNDSDIEPLLSTPRDVRVEVFTPAQCIGYDEPIAPIEALVIEVSKALSWEVTSRGPAVEVAQRLLASLDVAAKGLSRAVVR